VKRLISSVRTVDRVARFGGDEFGLILMQSDAATALEVAQRVCTAMRREAVTMENLSGLAITVSAGAAALPQHANTAPDLVAAADKALYTAKNNGRNCAVAAV